MINTVKVSDMISEESTVTLNAHFDVMESAERPPRAIQEIMPNLLESFASNDQTFDQKQKYNHTSEMALA